MNARCVSLVLLLAAGIIACHASSERSGPLFAIDFAAPVARSQATWSPADRLDLTAAGLGWDGEPGGVHTGWIQTSPQAVGFSWRPTRMVHFNVVVSPAPAPVPLANGQTIPASLGALFARYSPDRKNWSSWQPIPRDDQRPGAQAYSGLIAVPQREHERYAVFLREYAKLDVPWRSDEEAAVKWILEREPRFFERCLPFIGYVELLFEHSFQSGQRIARFDVHAGWSTNGMHHPPRDRNAQRGRDSRPWQFVAP